LSHKTAKNTKRVVENRKVNSGRLSRGIKKRWAIQCQNVLEIIVVLISGQIIRFKSREYDKIMTHVWFSFR
jgi:hypothetical protein